MFFVNVVEVVSYFFVSSEVPTGATSYCSAVIDDYVLIVYIMLLLVAEYLSFKGVIPCILLSVECKHVDTMGF